MTRRAFRPFIFMALAVLAFGKRAYAATKVVVGQITGDTASGTGSVLVTTPNTRTAAWAKLGGGLSLANGILSDTAVAFPTPAAEVPAGIIDGNNAVFTLTNAPLANTQLIIRNGLTLFPAAGDYSITGNQITFSATAPNGSAVPQPGDTLVAVYWH